MNVALRYGLYAIVALLVVSPTLFDPERVYGADIDLYGTLWFYWWIRHCVETFGDPGFTTLFFHPYGKDIFAHTGNNFVDALASVPLQWAFGRFYYETLLATLLLGNAIAMERLAALVSQNPVASWVAGLVFLVNPYALTELQGGRPTQAMQWFAVLALYFAVQAARRETWRDPLLGGACLALAGWTYWFEGMFVAVVVAVVGAAEGVRVLRQHPAAGALARMSRRYAVLAGSAAVGVAPAVWGMWSRARAGTISGVPDLASVPDSRFLSEPSVILMTHESWQPLLASGDVRIGYVTWVLAAVAGVWVGGRRESRPLVLGAGGLIAVFLALSLGPVLRGPDLDIPLAPYRFLLDHVPLFSRFWFPYRAHSVVFLLVPLLAALLIARTRGATRRTRLAVALGLLLPAEVALRVPLFPPPVTTLPERPVYAALGAAGGGVIELPFGRDQSALFYQTVHRQPLLGGMGESNPRLRPEGFDRRFDDSPLLRFLVNAPERPVALPRDEASREALVADGFRWVALHRDVLSLLEREGTLDPLDRDGEAAPGADGARPAAYTVRDVRRAITAELGGPAMVDGPVLVWSLGSEGPEVPRPLVPDAAEIERWDAGAGFAAIDPRALRRGHAGVPSGTR